MKLTAEDAEKAQRTQRKNIDLFSVLSVFPLFSLWFLYLFLIANEINRRGCGEDTEQAEENIDLSFVSSVVSVFVFNR